jgi:hypothetical protein
MQIYVSKNGQRYGPYSLEELRREVQANVFRPEHFASIDNCRTWEPISAIPGIGPLIYEVEADPKNQLLTIRYRGYVRSSAVRACAKEIKAALGKLQPGFRLLADLTELETMETDCAPALREIMHLCGKSGVSLVVRAIPDPRRDIGLGIMSYFHYGPTVQIATCTTLAEARGILAAKSRDEAAPDSPPND